MKKEFCKRVAIRSGVMIGLLTLGAIADAKDKEFDWGKTGELATKGAAAALIFSAGICFKQQVKAYYQRSIGK